MQQSEVMVYLMTGFLDSGKSQFLKFTLKQDYFRISGKTLLILCEEGEEEFHPLEMAQYQVVIERVTNQEEFTESYLEALNRKHRPERVVIEYNGMWKVSDFEQMSLPDGWKMEQKLTTVDASTFSMYLTNLKPLFVEMVRGSELVLFNRCTEIGPLPGYRRSVKVVNPSAEVIFEDEEGEIEDIFVEGLPFDRDADLIRIEPEDFGIWYLDVRENRKIYEGKRVELVAGVVQPQGLSDQEYLLGRMAMTCCADDLTFLGYLCRGELTRKLHVGQWVRVQAKITFARGVNTYGISPILELESVEEVEPIRELVYFN